MTTGTSGIWREFEHDPRDPAYAGMRASERDRDVVRDVLTSAYAEGRLDRDEYDERANEVANAKTYADLLPPIRDLTANAELATRSASNEVDLRAKAALYYREKLGESFFGFLIPNLICWAIWFIVGQGSFIWPIFVTIPTGVNLLRVAASRRSIVEGRVEKLERRQAKALEAPTKDRGTPQDSTQESVSEPGVDEA